MQVGRVIGIETRAGNAAGRKLCRGQMVLLILDLYPSHTSQSLTLLLIFQTGVGPQRGHRLLLNLIGPAWCPLNSQRIVRLIFLWLLNQNLCMKWGFVLSIFRSFFFIGNQHHTSFFPHFWCVTAEIKYFPRTQPHTLTKRRTNPKYKNKQINKYITKHT